MQQIKSCWRVLLAEPFRWIFAYLFQPTAFKSKFETDLVHRLRLILRISLPVFLCMYPIVLLVRLILPPLFPGLYVYTLANSGIQRFLLDTAWSTALGTTGGILGAVTISTTLGFTLCISVSLLGGIMVDTSTTADKALEVAIMAGMTYGILFGVLLGLTVSGAQSMRARSVLTIILGGILGCAIGIIAGLITGFMGGLLLGTLAPSITGPDTTQDSWGAVIGGTLAVSAMTFISGIVRGLARRTTGSILRAITVGRSIGIAFSMLMGVTGGVIGVISASRNIVDTGGQYNKNFGTIIGLTSGSVFLFCYVLSYFRLPLYPVSALSTLKAYIASRRHPAGVFHYLQHSALYWDERVFLPLPRLTEMLLIAARQDVQHTLREIAFILAERPQQTVEARQALLTIAIGDLEQRRMLPEIAQAEERLYELLPAEVRQGDAQWVKSLTSLSDASRNAALALSPVSRQARQRALDEIMINLNNVRPAIAFEDVRLNQRLHAIVEQWKTAVLQEVGKLKMAAGLHGALENPYVSGPSLVRDASSFVGRRDLVRQLEQALSKGRERPTLFLTGERRMGKTSTLNQLPGMLSARYISIFYDLQLRGITANSAAFLSTIAKEISLAVEARGLRVRKLDYTALQEAGRENAAVPYLLFDEWLRDLELVLAPGDLTILLAFDEFEKLRAAEKAGYLDLELYLDWFRSVVQNRPWLALLFSGAHGIGDMGPGWATYFVNVQMFKVSFLQLEEAHRLILKPTPEFPGEQIYDAEAVKEIMRITGCHPFLVQAVCSALIDVLNSEKRDWAELPDVNKAVQQMLESWWDTYFLDLWERTSPEQQLCLFALQKQGCSTAPKVGQQSGLAEKTAHDALSELLWRDLVIREDNTYRISTPIFAEWVTRHN